MTADPVDEPAADRRAAPRAATGRRAIVAPAETALEFHAQIADISPGGMRLIAPRALTAGSAVEIEVQPGARGGAPILARGEAAWCAPRAGGGFLIGVRLVLHAPAAEDAGALDGAAAHALLEAVAAQLHAPPGGGATPLAYAAVRAGDAKPPGAGAARRRRRSYWAVALLAALAVLLGLLPPLACPGVRDADHAGGRGPATAEPSDTPAAADPAVRAQGRPWPSEAVLELRAGRMPLARAALAPVFADAASGPAARLIAGLGLAESHLPAQPGEAIALVRRALDTVPGAPAPWRAVAESFREALEAQPGGGGPGGEAALPQALTAFGDIVPLADAPGDGMGGPLTPLDARAAAPAEPEAAASVRLVVDTGTFVLTVHRGDEEVARYPVGLGYGGSTPRGVFRIANRLTNPAWYHRGESVPAGDPRNPLGDYWMGLACDGVRLPIGIHPTKEAGSIGRNESRGCIRMRPEDAAALFDLAAVGTAVEIR